MCKSRKLRCRFCHYGSVFLLNCPCNCTCTCTCPEDAVVGERRCKARLHSRLHLKKKFIDDVLASSVREDSVMRNPTLRCASYAIHLPFSCMYVTSGLSLPNRQQGLSALEKPGDNSKPVAELGKPTVRFSAESRKQTSAQGSHINMKPPQQPTCMFSSLHKGWQTKQHGSVFSTPSRVCPDLFT